MIYPLDPSPFYIRSNSPKLDLYQLQNQLIQTKINPLNNSALCKLPSLHKEREASQKSLVNHELFRSILKKSVSLDLSQQARKKKLKLKSKNKHDVLEEKKEVRNKMDHYKKYIECMSHENINNDTKIHSNSTVKILEPRKTEMPYIRAEKVEYHNKNNSASKYNTIVYDETFVRIKSPGRIKSKIQTSRNLLNQSKIYSTIQQQQRYNSPYKQSSIRNLSHSPIKMKKRKILLEVMKAEGTETDLFFTPWQNTPETNIEDYYNL